MGQEGVLPGHAVVQALEAILGVGGVAADQIEGVKLGGDHPPLVVVLLDPQAVGHRQGFGLGKDRHTGVALLLGAVPELVVAGHFQPVGLAGVVLELGLLQAEDIRVQGLEGGHKIFL